MRREGTDKPRPISETLKVEVVAIRLLHADEENVRVHPDRNLAAIAASLKKFGQQAPVVFVRRGRRRVVIKGTGLLMAAKRLGWKDIVAVESTLTGNDATAFAIADNRTTDLSTFDEPLLAAQLQELDEVEYDIEVTGFTDDQLTEMLDELESAGEPIGDDTPATGERKRGERTAAIVIGHLKFEMPRGRFDQWMAAIEAKVGDDMDRVVREIKKRLKIVD